MCVHNSSLQLKVKTCCSKSQEVCCRLSEPNLLTYVHSWCAPNQQGSGWHQQCTAATQPHCSLYPNKFDVAYLNQMRLLIYTGGAHPTSRAVSGTSNALQQQNLAAVCSKTNLLVHVHRCCASNQQGCEQHQQRNLTATITETLQ